MKISNIASTNKFSYPATIILSFLITVLLIGCAPTSLVYVVRHGEKMPDGIHLSAEGIARAEALELALNEVRLSKIYSTNTIRTISTASPTAAAKGLPVLIYNNVDSLGTILQTSPSKQNVLVVGHSNTVPAIVRACGCAYVPKNLPDDSYDNLFVLKLKRGKACTLDLRKFGTIK